MDTQDKTTRQIAADAVARLYSGDMSEAQQCSLENWLDQAPANRAEFDNLLALWDGLAVLENEADIQTILRESMLQESIPQESILQESILQESMLQQSTLQQTTLQQTTLQERAAQTRPRRQPAKRMVRVAALAASLLIAAGAGLLYLQPQLKEENWLASYSTRVGEKREVRLPDGSQLDLNTHSKILVEYTQNERRIILDYGEVFFSVAKDTLRPMNITVGDRTISVLGTKFNVHWSGPTVTLAVVEGLVSVRDIQGGPRLKHLPADDGQLPVWEDPDSATVYVEAGATVQFAEKTHTVISTQPQKTEQLQSWRSGTLRFDNEPLHKVISEINRYTANKIIIEDKTLMETPVSGVFKMDDIDTVLKGLGSALDLRVSRQLNGYVIASADQASEITLQ